MYKISFKTLGCRLNQHETDALASAFDKAGYQIVDFKIPADVTIINTCTVTSQSDHKSRNLIMQAIRTNASGMVVVTGCMAEQYKQQLEAIPGVAMVVTNGHKSQIFEAVDNKLKNKPATPLAKNGLFSYEPVKTSLHTRAAIKIQDGCDNYCTFCIIPQVRGRATSRPVSQILDNVKQTIDNGFKEIVLTGVNIGRYYDNGTRFAQLVENVLNLDGDFRVRISSLEPDGFGQEFIDLFAHPKLTPHLHLCLQSGSDKILLKMRRMYSVNQYIELVEAIKKQHPLFNFTTDIIVGFPGETASDFKQTLSMVKQIGFSHVHTFKYSVREGTVASRMEQQVSERLKTERSLQLRTLSEQNKTAFYHQLVGTTQRVLVEKGQKGAWQTGYGQHYAPVRFKQSGILKNEWANVQIDSVADTEPMVLQGHLTKFYANTVLHGVNTFKAQPTFGYRGVPVE